MNNILFLHNTDIHYRRPLFERLQQYFGNRIDVWFYHEKHPITPSRTFSFMNVFIPFSVTCIFALLWDTKHSILILAGSHSYELPFFYLAARLRKKRIVFWTEMWNWGRMDLKNRLFGMVLSYIARRADRVVYPGKKTQEFYDALGIPRKRQFFAPNASTVRDVDPTKFSHIRADAARKHLVFMGRMYPRKGLKELLIAFTLLPPGMFDLWVGGSGLDHYEKECRALVSGQEHVHFLGPIPPEYAASFLSVCDVYVYPSQNVDGMAEPWGLSINEAVLLHKPIVTTTAVAAAYDLILSGKNGYSVTDRDIPALTEALQNAATLSPRDCERASIERSNIYSYDNMASGFAKAVEDIEL